MDQCSLVASSSNRNNEQTAPEDELLFYTASVNFLRKLLEEKSKIEYAKSVSCCNILQADNSTSNDISLNASPWKSSKLSMQQVLPSPKSNKESFFMRLKNSFRKYRRTVDLCKSELNSENEFISNFKFPCERFSNMHTSYLLDEDSVSTTETSRECV